MAGAKLKDVQIKKAKPSTKPYKLFDGGGMFLYVPPGGAKLWRWQFRYEGKYQLMSLGRYPAMSLEEARRSHQAEEKILRSGRNPMELRRQEKQSRKEPLAAPTANSFAAIEKQWFDHWKAGKQARYIEQMEARIAADILARLGDRPIDAIEAPEIAALAQAIEDRGAHELARKALRTVSQIFRYAIAHGYAQRNPASDLRPSDILKSVATANHPRVDKRGLPALLQAIENYTGQPLTKSAMRLMAMTFLRTSELVEAPWTEIDLEQARWEIPAERMKMKSAHIVPLARQAVAELRHIQALTGNPQWVFPHDWDPGRSMSTGAISGALKRMGYRGLMTGHGFRGLASTILHEQGYEEAHIEVQLAHLKRSKVSAAYDWAKYLESRKKMMQDWADYLDRQLKEATAPTA